MEKRGLGRGLGALIAQTLADDDAGSVREVRLTQIRSNPYQPRQRFEPEKLAELVQSIRQHGILQPVLLRRVALDDYELIAGERRLRAAQEAGLHTIPAIVKKCLDGQMLEIALIENLQREDINPVEAAMAYQRLSTDFGLTQEEIGKRVGKAQPTIANTLRLLALPEQILESLQRGEITEGHARTLLKVAPDAQILAWETVRRRRLSVRETERLAREMQNGPPKEPATRLKTEDTPAKDPNRAAVEEALQVALGTKVSIRQSGSVGRIEIEFYSVEELEGIVERIIGKGSAR